jgi:hypothetical protein
MPADTLTGEERCALSHHDMHCFDTVCSFCQEEWNKDRAENARLTALIEEADRNRDAMWCKALTVLDPKEIHAATKAFNELRARREEG